MRCKVCESELKSQIDDFINSGSDLDWLCRWSKDRGLSVNSKQLEKHAIDHLAVKPTHQPKTRSDKAEKTDNDGLMSFEDYCKGIGIDFSDIYNLDKNINKVIYGSQKALTLLFLKNCAVVDFKLNNHLTNKGDYPSNQIKGLRSIYEMYARVIGIENLIDENAAINTLESMGYTVNKVIDVSCDNL